MRMMNVVVRTVCTDKVVIRVGNEWLYFFVYLCFCLMYGTSTYRVFK
jgi:hypothetical protein